MEIFEINYEMLPESCRDGMKRYIERGVIPGHFLTAVLENDFVEAVCRADHENLARILDFAHFIYNEAPQPCWGSVEKVTAWSEAGGWRQWEKTG